MNCYILYKTDDKTVLSFIAQDIHEQYVPAEGQSVTSNYLEFEKDELPDMNKVMVDENGLGKKK
jgi:hypothetical protein